MVLRVVHVVESLEPEAGSVAVALRGLLDALEARGIEAEAVTAFEPGAADQLVRGAVVVHFHGWGTALARNMAGAARKAGTPYVISPLGLLSTGPYHQKGWRDRIREFLYENKLVRAAAAITALNARDQQALRAADLNARIQVLPYGLSIGDYEATEDAVDDLPTAPEGRCLLLLGPIHPVEGLVPLLRAVAELGTDADGWNIVFAGRETGDWRKMLEAAVRRKGAADRVLFTTAPDLRTQRAWLARASVLAAPGLHFRCPVSIVQAVAAGVPAIASEHTAPDALDGTIRVCAPNREALKEALRFVFRLSDEDRASLARKARDVSHARLDWPVLVDEYVQLYENLVRPTS